MARPWEKALRRWTDAGLIDPASADRVRRFELERDERRGRKWPVVMAWCAGGLLTAAGVLLFVAAHWDRLSPAGRFFLVLCLVALFHGVAAIFASSSELLARVLHGVGTATLGAGIFLTGQIFNLQEHWPGGVMLWAIGAWLGWALLRDWVQAGLAVLLTPVWLAGEWIEATQLYEGVEWPLYVGLWVLALAYFTARTPEWDTPVRRVLVWLGGLALIPLTFELRFLPRLHWGSLGRAPSSLLLAGWIAALCLPLALGWMLRRLRVWPVALAAGWAVLLGSTAGEDIRGAYANIAWHQLGPYLLCGVGSLLLVWWGLAEVRRERINLGVAGFGLTVACFYFDTVMDKLGRSMSLIGLGVLFLVGGWFLERSRRSLIARLTQAWR